MATFISNGELTEEGRATFAYMDRLIENTDKGMFNTLPGLVKSYLANVKKLGTVSTLQFAESYPSQLGVIHDNMLMEAEQAATERRNAETADKADAVANELEALKAALAEAKAEIDALKEAKVTVTVEDDEPKRKGRKAKAAVEPEPEAEEGSDEGEDAASEA